MLLGDELIASKQKTGIVERLFGQKGFPDEDDVIKALREHLNA